RIVADESSNSLLIRATPRDYRQLLKTISLLDQVPKEVMINVVIAEVTLTESTKFGIDWQSFFRGSKAGQTDTYLQTNFNVSNSTGLVLNHVEGNLNLILNMMDATGDVSILSRPSLLVRNNEEASINVGANEPFVTGETSSTTSEFVTTNVQYKDTGISVKVTPRINDDGIINLDIFQELSQLGETRADLQSFLTRKIETSVVVRDKSAIVIGGLIEKRQNNSENGIPFLKDIPIFGKLFASTEMVETRTELVLIIVPEIVNPEADNSPLVRKFKQRMNLVSKLLNQNYILTDN
ncbi:MAG: type II secretion system protein GspD, partial [Thiomargarita sp.]|nr:type II secretion system protein GspD [Thiomargarita sp.]